MRGKEGKEEEEVDIVPPPLELQQKSDATTITNTFHFFIIIMESNIFYVTLNSRVIMTVQIIIIKNLYIYIDFCYYQST